MRKIDRFIKYLEYKGISENKATVECGLSVGLIGQAKRGKSDLGEKAIDKILNKYLELSKVWLLTGEGEMLNTSDHPPIEIDPVSGGEINVRQLMNMMQKQMDMVNSVIEQNKQLLNKNDKLVAENAKLMQELMKLGKEERPAIEDFGSVEDRQ